MKILIATSEMVPLAKTGGLADVTGALINELRSMGHDVRAVMPYYRAVKNAGFDIKHTGHKFSVHIRNQVEAEIYETTSASGSPIYLIRNDSYYDRDQLYQTRDGDYPDNCERFVFFNKAVFHLMVLTGFIPDVIHCHDWQTGLIPAYIKTIYTGSHQLRRIKTVFTIHNLAYQGLFWYFDLPMTGLPEECYTPEGIEFYGKINFLKAGLVYSDKLTTVSAKYSREIQTQEFGCGLEGVLTKRAGDLIGILNGVDYNEWSPEKDAYLAESFSAAQTDGKRKCREDLLEQFGVSPGPDTPVIGIVSRLTDQKGFDIFAEAAPAIMDLDVCFVVLGSGEPKYEALFRDLAARFPGKMGVKIAFNNALAHKIEAGSDMFLMPSRFEPCGLNQIYSLRYGTIPIVRATGGLDDTIVQYEPSCGEGNGFKFDRYSASALAEKIGEAARVFRSAAAWKRLVQNAMKADFSWGQSCRKYDALFRGLASS